MIDVHLKDHRTVLRVLGRGQLVDLIGRHPDHLNEGGPLRLWIDRGLGEGFIDGRLQYLSRASMAWIEQVMPEVRDAFLTKYAPHYLDDLQAKRDEYATAPVPAASVNGVTSC